MRAAMLSVAFAGLWGCVASGPKGSDDDGPADTADSGAADDGDGGIANDVDPDELNGSVPDSPLAAPEFVATNRDGAGRAREDLLGHPTVMWFYPAAATAG